MYAKEREEVERQVKEHMENMERIKKEKLEIRKSNQNDLLYQISEREKIRNKENHYKFLEERTAKILEAEYIKKIEEFKQIQNRKVNFFNFQ
jgi:hypothetical protein